MGRPGWAKEDYLVRNVLGDVEVMAVGAESQVDCKGQGVGQGGRVESLGQYRGGKRVAGPVAASRAGGCPNAGHLSGAWGGDACCRSGCPVRGCSCRGALQILDR